MTPEDTLTLTAPSHSDKVRGYWVFKGSEVDVQIFFSIMHLLTVCFVLPMLYLILYPM